MKILWRELPPVTRPAADIAADILRAAEDEESFGRVPYAAEVNEGEYRALAAHFANQTHPFVTTTAGNQVDIRCPEAEPIAAIVARATAPRKAGK